MVKKVFGLGLAVLVLVIVTAACAPAPTPTPAPTATQFPPLTGTPVPPVPSVTPTLVPVTPSVSGSIYFQGLFGNEPWSIYKLDLITGEVKLVIRDGEAPDVHNGKIVFVRWDYKKRAGDLWIWSSGGEHRLTNNPSGTVSYPRWSPSGHKIAFDENYEAGGTAVVVMASDGTHRVEIISGGPDFPTWVSEDELLVRHYSGGQMYLDKVDLNGNSLPTGLAGVSFYDVDPYGRIAYSGCSGDLFVNTNGTSRKLWEGDVGWPAWSPDGKWVVFDLNYGETTQFVIISIDGKTSMSFDIPGWATRPVWVP